MKFDKSRLLEAVKKEIKKREDSLASRLAELQEEYDAAAEEWLNSEHPQILRRAAQAVSRKVARGKVVTYEDVDVFSTRSGHVFAHTKPKDDFRINRAGSPSTDTLEALQDVLEMAQDTTVTTASLREMGFTNLGPLLRSAAKG